MTDQLALLVDLHKRAERQGPGSDEITRRAIDLTGLSKSDPLKVADIGCGTGASALVLAEDLNAAVSAIDFLPEFIGELELRAKQRGISSSIDPLVCDMGKLPFDEAGFDLIWSEGAIYNIGFERGVREWAQFLKPGGILVASEITWTTATRPAQLQQYWDAAYPEIDTASNKISILENSGYSPIAYFTLPEACWLDNYYYPVQGSFDAFLERNGNSEEAQGIVAAEREEIALYESNSGYYSYGMYIAQKRGG